MRFVFKLLILMGLGWFAARLLEEDRRHAGKVAKLDDFERRLAAQDSGPGPLPDAFVDALDALIARARASGSKYVDINAGALHRQVGEYPGPGHRMATCCGVMRSALRRGDMVLSEPKSGVGATLTLRYHLEP